MDLPDGVRAHDVQTDRLRVHHLESGPADGVPVVLVHGNLSTGRFFEHLLPGAPERFRFLVPDMRGFGDTERVPIDATRGLRDWADDVRALLDALGVEGPPHLAGWSTGGAAIAAYAREHPVASLTFIDPVSPYGFGGTHPDGTPCQPDWAGSGGGTGNPEFAQRIASGDDSAEDDLSPRRVLRTSYWSPTHTVDPDREDLLVAEVLKSEIGDDGYPGDLSPSDHWPGVAPGTRGILNALSGKYCGWADLADVDHTPPVLWVHGEDDVVVADGSPWEMGTLGQAGAVPAWPGPEVFPPQQMVTQIRDVLDRYAHAGGSVRAEIFEGSGHAPFIDDQTRFETTFFGFLEEVA